MEKKIKKITIKNYLILALIFLGTICLTIYFCRCYSVYNEKMKEVPVIRGVISEITSEELEHYVNDNPNCIVYMCIASDMKCRNFEQDFIKLIKKKNLQEEIVYLNLSNVDQEKFTGAFNDKYKYSVQLTTNYPAIVTFEENKVSNIIQEDDGELSITKAKQFIELNRIGE